MGEHSTLAHRCHRPMTDMILNSFGAVLEEFEVRDALENAFSMKPEVMVY
jgi:hypothetical protein